MKKQSLGLTTTLLVIFITAPTLAQNMDSDTSGSRIEKIERDLMLLQRQISRSPNGSSNSSALTGNADFEVRLSTIEDNLRELLGKTEENEFQIRKISENLDKLQRDTDFRFGELTNTQPKIPTTLSHPSATPIQNSVEKERKIPNENLKINMGQDNTSRPVGRTIDTTNNANESEEQDESDGDAIETEFSSPREHYNYAFRLLNQTQYDRAATSFADFIKTYPKDPLIGNAYYWQGETFYIRRDYVKAADSFRQGFEQLPNGPKAPDNLLKLAMTLNALKRNKEACVVLGQIVLKFKDKSAVKVAQEQKRIDCK